jgi:hypothetical protein
MVAVTACARSASNTFEQNQEDLIARGPRSMGVGNIGFCRHQMSITVCRSEAPLASPNETAAAHPHRGVGCKDARCHVGDACRAKRHRAFTSVPSP